MMAVPAGVRIHLALGATDMRKGFGSEGGANRWAIVASLVETAKLDGVEPYVWLCDSLTQMVDGHPAKSTGYEPRS